jgi:signal transduction histidine kinase
MTDTSGLAMTGLYTIPAVLWGVLTYSMAAAIRRTSARVGAVWMYPVWSCLIAVIYSSLALGELARPDAVAFRGWLAALGVSTTIAVGAVNRHLAVAASTLLSDDGTPSRGWLMVNYGSAVPMAAIALLALRGPDDPSLSVGVAVAYLVVMTSLGMRHGRANIRQGPLRLGSLATQLHRADVAVFSLAAAILVTAVAVAFVRPGPAVDLGIALVGIVAVAAPALRNLTAFIRGAVLTLATLAAAAAVHVGAEAKASHVGPVAARFIDLAAILILTLLLVPARSWLHWAVDAVLLRHSRRTEDRLEAFLRTLPAEAGLSACCQAALRAVVRSWELRGGAILLDDGTTLVEGDLAFEPVRRVWPHGTARDALPARPFSWLAVRDVGLRRTLAAADVATIVPIVSPQRRWGHLFTSLPLLGLDNGRDELNAAQTFCDHLALVLDGAELLARAVAVERSLAHAEKLAAIGELVARIAHEIRNPVTAARSLAEQLLREPEAPFTAEHELILAELQRIERQVAALLRFARRDEFRFEPVDLGTLARETVDSFRARLGAAGIGVAVDVTGTVEARADREKMRQVLVNLIENSLAALTAAEAERRLAVVVGGMNGTATLRVTDTGPGVPSEALPHLFEPFFSLKDQGTGLGLAIAKRTVDAHGGRITAASTAGAGMTVEIELPLARRSLA